ncbi:hypothetical protein M378DRAFT_914166 [Amanita muscaria Koide BX008]|uniref:Uncharacterized protein n=1 Tax=Amanita muscaria (strain Koide BX008) TaxID=946122 RepID=A0A0C2WUW6_AMAMK|nr:hypothetical protein M378DRAFT_914166 [Amanita muscaria Koide BX008]
MLWFWMKMITIFWHQIYSYGSMSIAYLWASTIIFSDGFNWSILIVIDSVLIYRCWTVFGNNWFIICFPLVLWGYCLLGAIGALYCDLAPSFQFEVWQTTQSATVCWQYFWTWGGIIFYVCNTMIGIYTTSAMVYKIRHAAKNRNSTNRLLHGTRRILTESGILYTVSSASNLGWRVIKLQLYDNEVAFDLQFLGQIVEPVIVFMPIIAFHLITIRVGEQRAGGQDSWVDSMSANIRSELLQVDT